MKHSHFDVNERNAGAEALANKLLNDDNRGDMPYGPCREIQKKVRELTADLSQAVELMNMKHDDIGERLVMAENALEEASLELHLLNRVRKSFIDMRETRRDAMREGNSHYRILTDYTPPFAKAKDRKATAKVVVWNPERDSFLRFDENPVWDMYGTDYGTIERAKEAIKKIDA